MTEWLDGTIEFLLPFEAGLQSVAGLPQKIAALKAPALHNGHLRGWLVTGRVTKDIQRFRALGAGDLGPLRLNKSESQMPRVFVNQYY